MLRAHKNSFESTTKSRSPSPYLSIGCIHQMPGQLVASRSYCSNGVWSHSTCIPNATNSVFDVTSFIPMRLIHYTDSILSTHFAFTQKTSLGESIPELESECVTISDGILSSHQREKSKELGSNYGQDRDISVNNCKS